MYVVVGILWVVSVIAAFVVGKGHGKKFWAGELTQLHRDLAKARAERNGARTQIEQAQRRLAEIRVDAKRIFPFAGS